MEETKLIVDFMRYPFSQKSKEYLINEKFYTLEELHFDKSFDLLIPVGKKLLSEEFIYNFYKKYQSNIWVDYDWVSDGFMYSIDDVFDNKWELDELYEVIVAIIKEINKFIKSKQNDTKSER